MAVTGLAVCAYGCFRFFVEFFRMPDAHLGFIALDWLTMGQILSTPMILIGGFLFYWANRNKAR
jgi:phosphatidylglycerol:prolipoprotein diacylglycerol transferase